VAFRRVGIDSEFGDGRIGNPSVYVHATTETLSAMVNVAFVVYIEIHLAHVKNQLP